MEFVDSSNDNIRPEKRKKKPARRITIEMAKHIDMTPSQFS
jgi:phage anti-repressor protein